MVVSHRHRRCHPENRADHDRARYPSRPSTLETLASAAPSARLAAGLSVVLVAGLFVVLIAGAEPSP
jgi:hypothetical protein